MAAWDRPPIDIAALVRERQDDLLTRRLDRIEYRFTWRPTRPCPLCYGGPVESDGPLAHGRWVCRAGHGRWERDDG
jgi:hypothetical protein